MDILHQDFFHGAKQQKHKMLKNIFQLCKVLFFFLQQKWQQRQQQQQKQKLKKCGREKKDKKVFFLRKRIFLALFRSADCISNKIIYTFLPQHIKSGYSEAAANAAAEHGREMNQNVSFLPKPNIIFVSLKLQQSSVKTRLKYFIVSNICSFV